MSPAAAILAICFVAAASAGHAEATPLLSCGDRWIQNSLARVELGEDLSYSLWSPDNGKWECLFNGFPGGESWGAPAGTRMIRTPKAVKTRIDGQTAIMEYVVAGDMPGKGNVSAVITTSLLPESPFMRVTCMDDKGNSLSLGFCLKLSHPSRYCVFDEPLSPERFIMGQTDATGEQLRPNFLFWPGRRFMAVADPSHPYICAIFRLDGGTPAALACGLYSGGKKFINFTHVNESFVIAGGMFSHETYGDEVFHWATGLWCQLNDPTQRKEHKGR